MMLLLRATIRIVVASRLMICKPSVKKPFNPCASTMMSTIKRYAYLALASERFILCLRRFNTSRSIPGCT